MSNSENIIQKIKIGETQYSLDSIKLDGKTSDEYQEDNLVTTISSKSTTSQYPSAACLYRLVGDLSLVDGSSDTPSKKYTLTLATNGYGTIISVPDGGVYDAGTSVEITAQPYSDTYVFMKWSDENTSITRTVVMNSDITLSAIFAIKMPDHQDDPGYEPFDPLLD